MEAQKILHSDILDIIFEKRNKSYGAYQLRKEYNARLKQSLLIAAFLVTTMMALVGFNQKKNNRIEPLIVKDIEMSKVEIISEKIKVKLPSAPKAAVKKQMAQQDQLVPPKVVADHKVDPNDKIVSLRPTAAIGQTRIDSGIVSAKVEPIIPKSEPVQGIANVVKPEPVDNSIHKSVQKQASFPGGNAAWRNYLMKTLNANVPNEEGAAPGSYTVIVAFNVMKDGSIGDVKAETINGFGMEQEAVRAIVKGPRWQPAMQNNLLVNYRQRQPITFFVQEQ